MFKMLSYFYVSCDKILPNKHIRRLGTSQKFNLAQHTVSTTRLSSHQNCVIRRKMQEIYQWIETGKQVSSTRFLLFDLHLPVYFLRTQKTSSRFPTVSIDSCFRLFNACDFLFHIKIRQNQSSSVFSSQTQVCLTLDNPMDFHRMLVPTTFTFIDPSSSFF